MIDSLTLGVLVTLLIDILGLFFIILGFICIRRFRGDKQTVSSNSAMVIGPDAMIDMLFQESLDSQKLEEQLEIESDLVRRKTVDLQWAVHEEEQLGTTENDNEDNSSLDLESEIDKSQKDDDTIIKDKKKVYDKKSNKNSLKNKKSTSKKQSSLKIRKRSDLPPFQKGQDQYSPHFYNNQDVGSEQNFQKQIAEPLISNQHSKLDDEDYEKYGNNYKQHINVHEKDQQQQQQFNYDMVDGQVVKYHQQYDDKEIDSDKNSQILIEKYSPDNDQQQQIENDGEGMELIDQDQKYEIEEYLQKKAEDDEKEARKRNIKESLMRKFSIIKNALRGRSLKTGKPGASKKKPQGIMDWLYILRKISDEDLKVISGTDGALYLVFQRFAAKFFAVISIINFLLFVPIYVTGSPSNIKDMQDDQGEEIILSLLTIMNITSNEDKLLVVFIIMMLGFTIAAYVFMFFYWKMSADWRYRKHSHKEKFLDYDIALHSLQISNLPTEQNMLSMSRKIRMVFERIFPDSKVISAKAIGKLDDLYAMALRLRELKKNYRYYKMQNKKLAEKGMPRTTFKKRKGCFTSAVKYDAEDYYKQKIKKKMRDIQAEKERKMKINGGFGFVTFISNLQVKKCLHKNHFKTLIMDHLSQEERLSTQALQWKVRQAPAQSDIIWENMYKDDGISQVKSWFLVALLFISCVVFITPVSIIDNLKPIIDAITSDLGSNNFISIVLTTYLSPLILLIFNFGIIPLLIDLIAFLEDHKTKSLKQLGIMRKNFFFQLFNTVILQLTAQSTIFAFIELYSKKSWEDLPQELGAKLVNNNFFFLRYTIQLCFISNGVQLLDIPHHLIKIIKYFFHVRANKKEIQPKPFIDDFAFDLGYHQSYSIVIFSMGLIFSGTCPLISIFAMLFFAIKYYIDKYNLTFVYNKEFEGGGAIKKQVLPFVLFSIYFFQILNMGYYSSNFGIGYFKGGMVFITIESLILIFLNVHYSTKKKAAKDKLAQLEDEVKCMNLEDLDNKNANSNNNDQIDQALESEGTQQEQEKRKNTVLNFVNGNLMKGTARRLTMVGHEEMSKENVKKLHEAYKHPFDKIPKSYFSWNTSNQTKSARSSRQVDSERSANNSHYEQRHKNSGSHKSINHRNSTEGIDLNSQ